MRGRPEISSSRLGHVTPDCVHSQIVGLLRGATGRDAGQLFISSLQLAESTCTSNNKSVLLMQYSWFREVACRKEVYNELCIKLCSDHSHLCLTFLDAGANAVVSSGSYIEKIVWTNMTSSDKALNCCWAFLIVTIMNFA